MPKRSVLVYGARLLLLATSLALVLGLGELWARATWREGAPARLPDAAHADLPLLRTVAEISTPGVRGIHVGVPFRTNSLGLRGPEIQPVAAPGTRRVGLTGDSIAMGWGVEEERRYSDVAERRLNRTPGGATWEIVNTGIAGFDAAAAMRILARFDDELDFDALVYGFTANDIEGEHYEVLGHPGGHKQRFAQLTWARRSPSYLWRVVWPKLLVLRSRISSDEVSIEEELLYNYLENDAAWADFDAALARLAQLSAKAGRCGLVLLHTHLSDLGSLHAYHPIYARVTRAAEDHGLVVLPSFDAFAGYRGPELWVGAFDPHPNAQAHAVLAELLAEGLLALPGRCWDHARARDRRG